MIPSVESSTGGESLNSGSGGRSYEGIARWASKAVFSLADLALPVPPGPRLLIYHDVTSNARRQMELVPEAFTKHVEWLQGNGRIVSLEEALSQRHLDESRRSYVLTFDDGFSGVFDYVFPLLGERAIPFTLYLTSGLIGQSDSALKWSQVNEMLESGLVTIGAHTQSHPDLRFMSPVEVEDELDISNSEIQEHTGLIPKHFAYPFGYWSATAESAVRERYVTAVLGAGEPITDRTELHRLTRVPIQRSDGHFFFKRKVLRGMRLEESVRRRVKRYGNPDGATAPGPVDGGV